MAETFTDNAQAGRYELDVDGKLAWADYRRHDGVLIIPHVEAEMALRGTGAADRLMRQVAVAAKAEGTRIIPTCGYAQAWLRRHEPELIAG
ncbi:GNAT family N-acetyltransferase [Caulobacter sp. NIBR2454]|uniref:GNAT family N-acetyltransferase n=1 Tax=Caulobacter sp. NIBR2454 TaxID=3015996 RepID=UPI0022B7359E|nr:GNAT family N-acetyltransferase [Caulobacter sp. NIBR2454]